jgi:hypothetical protein
MGLPVVMDLPVAAATAAGLLLVVVVATVDLLLVVAVMGGLPAMAVRPAVASGLRLLPAEWAEVTADLRWDR